jgi:hypothetical protein
MTTALDNRSDHIDKMATATDDDDVTQDAPANNSDNDIIPMEYTQRLFRLSQIEQILPIKLRTKIGQKRKDLLEVLAPDIDDVEMPDSEAEAEAEEESTGAQNTAAPDESMKEKEKLSHVLQVENTLPLETRTKMNEYAKELLDDLVPDAAEFLHDGLDARLHSRDEVRTFIRCIPDALSKVKYSDLPIETIIYCRDDDRALDGNVISFVPLFAEEGERLSVGGKGTRGGLLPERDDDDDDDDSDDDSCLLADITGTFNFEDEEKFDSNCLNVLIELREMNILRKEDIRKYELQFQSCRSYSKKRFQFLVDWDPDSLKQELRKVGKGETLLNHTSRYIDGEGYDMVLKAGLKHHPYELGGLAFDNKVDREFELEKDEFTARFEFERRWNTVIKKSLEECDDGKLMEKNAETNLYPFILAASVIPRNQVDIVYYLLRRNPIACIPSDSS